MSFIKTKSGLNWCYDIKGEGEPLVFIHGWASDRRIWRQQYEYFSSRYKVLSIDLPGHGKSEWQPMSLKQMSKDLDFILNELGLKNINVVGSSMGGLMALKYFQMFNKNVKRIVLVGSTPKFVKAQNHRFGLERTRIRRLERQIDTDYPAILNIFFRSLFTIHERQSVRFKWLQTFGQTGKLPQKEALKGFLKILEKEDLRIVLNIIDIPVLFVNGTEDYICPKESVYMMKQEVRRSRLVFFEECGHFPFLSKPREFNNVMEQFFEAMS